MPRLNSVIGSPQTGPPLKKCLPRTAPTSGVEAPTLNGQNPHTCMLDASNSGGASTNTCAPSVGPSTPFAVSPGNGTSTAVGAG